MTCPECGVKLKTMETAQTANNDTYRRKKCPGCGRVVFTIEYEVEADEQYRQDWREARPWDSSRRRKNSKKEN